MPAKRHNARFGILGLQVPGPLLIGSGTFEGGALTWQGRGGAAMQAGESREPDIVWE